MLQTIAKHIRQRKNNLNTPTWYVMLVALTTLALIFILMIMPYIRLAKGIPIDPLFYTNPRIGQKLPPIKDYALAWGSMDIVGFFICLFLGFVCFLLGITRNINKLDSKQIYSQALFLGLFAINNLSIVPVTANYIPSVILFYSYWLTFYAYPVALFVYFFYHFAPAFQKWTWSFLAIPVIYGTTAWLLLWLLKLPLDIPAKFYTEVAAVCFVIFLLVGLIGVNQKSMTWFIRSISGFWIGWACYFLIKAQLGCLMQLHDEFKNGVTISAVVIVCFLVFFNMQELASYKTDMQLLTLQNRLAKDSYEHIKAHLKEVGGIKHEMRNHIAVMQLYIKDGRYEEAGRYLDQFAAQANLVTEVVYHDNYLINAVVGNLLYKARELDTKVTLNLSPAKVSMAEPDLYSLLNNILQNALTACALVPEGGNRFVHLTIAERKPYLCITCKNSKFGEVIEFDGIIQTTKLDAAGHGYGLWIISRIVDAYEGLIDTEYDELTFTIAVAVKGI